MGFSATHLRNLHFPFPHLDGLLQVPINGLLLDVQHHRRRSELRQLLPELLVQGLGFGPVLGGEGPIEIGDPWASGLLGPGGPHVSPQFQCSPKSNVWIFKEMRGITKFRFFYNRDVFIQFRSTVYNSLSPFFPPSTPSFLP